jgi:PPK2 family polyphosphate:nucleotide phosphotransferase
MKTKKLSRKNLSSLIKPYRVEDGRDFRLKRYSPADTGGFSAEYKSNAKELLQRGIEFLAEEQDKLYAQDRWALLLIFQAMDAAGKDGTIKHVMSGINPQGVQVFSFKSPSAEDLDHDFMWRTMRCLPERGRIGIFNRSYYEEVLVVKVHPEFLKAQHLPESLVTKDIWDDRYDDIRNIERYLTRNGVAIRKFFLNVSKGEQKKRFMSRLDEPEKNWKFSSADVKERQCWDDYQDAYEKMIRKTSSKDAPWFVIPADNKWFARLMVGAVVAEALLSLDLAYPVVGEEKKKELAKARQLLQSEGSK